ncbi:MAG: LOG family protein [Monoglobus pectinilyticus]
MKEYGGYITAVAPQTPRLNNPLFQEIDELILSDDKRKRKELQEKNSDMFVVLPTGIGVLDELFEILVLKSYGELKQRIVIVNIKNMYDNLKVLLQDMDAIEYCDFVDSVDRIFMNDKSQMIN